MTAEIHGMRRQNRNIRYIGKPPERRFFHSENQPEGTFLSILGMYGVTRVL